MRDVRQLSGYLAAAMLVAALTGCDASAPSQPLRADRHVVLGGRQLACEVADTEAERQRGLEGYAAPTDGSAMLFVLDAPQRARIVMKSVPYPIDVAFVDTRGSLVQTATLQPGDQEGVTARVPVRYVLELPAGWLTEAGIGLGAPLRMPVRGPALPQTSASEAVSTSSDAR